MEVIGMIVPRGNVGMLTRLAREFEGMSGVVILEDRRVSKDRRKTRSMRYGSRRTGQRRADTFVSTKAMLWGQVVAMDVVPGEVEASGHLVT